jgi:two-component system phosphate regulon response regulator PhoB
LGKHKKKKMNQEILVVEDETAIRSMINFSLSRAGFQVKEAKNVEQAKEQINNKSPDLVLIDWMLPDESGLELAKSIKQDEVTKGIGIIMLTAKAEERDKIAGFESGADDYVTKPFSQHELVARIKAVLRRTSYGEDEQLVSGPIVIDLKSYRILINDEEVHFGPTEFKLLKFFVSNEGRVYSRSQLLDRVWGRSVFVEERTVDVHIRRLRSILERFDLQDAIKTVRGAGYRFDL